MFLLIFTLDSQHYKLNSISKYGQHSVLFFLHAKQHKKKKKASDFCTFSLSLFIHQLSKNVKKKKIFKFIAQLNSLLKSQCTHWHIRSTWIFYFSARKKKMQVDWSSNGKMGNKILNLRYTMGCAATEISTRDRQDRTISTGFETAFR